MRPVGAIFSADFIFGQSARPECTIPDVTSLTSDPLGSVVQRQRASATCGAHGRGVCRRWEASKYDEARKTPQPLLSAEPNNARYLDPPPILTRAEKSQRRDNRLKNARDLRVNPVLQLNLATYSPEASQKRRKPF